MGAAKMKKEIFTAAAGEKPGFDFKKNTAWPGASDAETKLCELVRINQAILERLTSEGEPVDPASEEVLQVLQETRDCVEQLKATRLIPLGNVCYS